MNFKSIKICCPQCRGELERRQDLIACLSCGRTYPIILDIPDLRISPDPYIGMDEDRAKGRRLAEHFGDFDFEGFVDFYYSMTAAVPAQDARRYKRGVMAALDRAENWLRSWETVGAGNGRADRLLDIGCGTAPLLVAAKNYPCRVGLDIAFRWLVVAKKRLADARMDLPLICACAEALPFPSGAFDRVVADSALEHLKDQPQALTEIHRVLRPGGLLFIATPNRFSLGPDPHTGIWGGGWLPRRWTDALVRRKNGIPPVRKLLDVFTLKSLLRKAHFNDIRIFLPTLPPGQRQHFSPMMNRLMAVYDVASHLPGGRHLLCLVGPLLQGVAARRE
jgi:ubiquinone/menaquinone biosynthesis C-methylase UbiE/uncharacterized protein YbaR (Trm112 family)